jgi:hypothetical protein
VIAAFIVPPHWDLHRTAAMASELGMRLFSNGSETVICKDKPAGYIPVAVAVKQ